MNLDEDNFKGLAFICSPTGIITEVLSSQATDCVPVVGINFLSLVHESSRLKAFSFMQSIQARGVVEEWELNVNRSGTPERLHFVGAAISSGLLVVGSSNDNDADRFINEFMRMNNELADTLRDAIKKTSRAETAFNELSAMNNELSSLQRQLLKANRELQESNTLKNHIVGMAAHDLRGPLGSFTRLSDMLLRMIPDPSDDIRLIIEEMTRSAQNMFTIVNDLLDISAIEAGKLELHRDQTDLVELVDRCITLHRLTATPKSICIEREPTTRLSRLSLDAGKIEQVVNNLLSNAVKYSPLGSTVTVHIATEGSMVHVSVADRGKGIPLDRQSELFKPFSRVGSLPTGGEKSTGLGLAICRRIVEGHGGHIWVESKPGTGATFRFTVPIYDRSMATEA